MHQEIANKFVEYIDPIHLMNRPSNKKVMIMIVSKVKWVNVQLCFHQPHGLVDLNTVIALAIMALVAIR